MGVNTDNPTISAFLRHCFGLDVSETGQVRGSRVMIKSPFREESHPSFDIKEDRLWYDHGTGEGGGIWQLAYKYLGEENKSKAYHLLREVSGHTQTVEPTSFQRGPGPDTHDQVEHSRGIKILGTYPLNNVHLLDYIKRRGVRVEVAKEFCCVVVFLLNNKKTYSIGFRNNSGGYELRNECLKLSSSPKDVTHIQSNPQSRSNKLIVFEGFFDFLSHKTLERGGCCADDINNDYLILNGVGNTRLAKEIVARYPIVHAMLDLDDAGDEATEQIASFCTGEFEDLRSTYPLSKDLNQELVEGNNCNEGYEKAYQEVRARRIRKHQIKI